MNASTQPDNPIPADQLTPTIGEIRAHDDWPDYNAAPGDDGMIIIRYPMDEEIYFLLTPEEYASLKLARPDRQ